MKKQTNEVKKSKKNPTTNYASDSHWAFCVRCFAKHGGKCPNGNAKTCSL